PQRADRFPARRTPRGAESLAPKKAPTLRLRLAVPQGGVFVLGRPGNKKPTSSVHSSIGQGHRPCMFSADAPHPHAWARRYGHGYTTAPPHPPGPPASNNRPASSGCPYVESTTHSTWVQCPQ